MLDINGSGDDGYQMAEISGAAGWLQFMQAVQFLGDGYLIYCLSPLAERHAGFVDQPVRFTVEVFRPEKRINFKDGDAIYQ